MTEPAEPTPEAPDAEPDEPASEPAGDDEEEAAEEEPAPGEENEEEAPSAGPLSEDDQAKVFDKAIKRAKTYMSAVPTILGDSAVDLSLCPRCTDLLPGFVLPLRIKPVSPEQKVAVKQSIGELGEPELLPADDAFECGKCGGWGRVLTGSKKPKEREAGCLECNGRGWVGPRVNKLAQQPPEQRAVLNGDGDAAPEPVPLADVWGRPRDHPGFHVMPYQGMPREQLPDGWSAEEWHAV